MLLVVWTCLSCYQSESFEFASSGFPDLTEQQTVDCFEQTFSLAHLLLLFVNDLSTELKQAVQRHTAVLSPAFAATCSDENASLLHQALLRLLSLQRSNPSSLDRPI